MCMQSQCTLCDRGQQEDRFIPVQFGTITHRLRAQQQQQQQVIWYWESKVVHINHTQHHHHHHKGNEWLPTRGIIIYYCYYLEKKRAVILLQQQMFWFSVHCNGCLHSLLCMSLQCTLCKRGQPKNRFIPVQLWTLTHCLLAYLMCYLTYFVCFFSFCSIVCVCLLSIFLSVFVSLWLCILIWFLWMQSFADCSIHFDMDIHAKGDS